MKDVSKELGLKFVIFAIIMISECFFVSNSLCQRAQESPGPCGPPKLRKVLKSLSEPAGLEQKNSKRLRLSQILFIGHPQTCLYPHVLNILETPVTVTPQQKISKNFKFIQNSLEILNVYFWGDNVYFWAK